MITIQKDIPLAPYTSFGIGGPAAYFITAGSAHELRQAILFARENNLPYCILGGGTNILVSDEGFDGVVIKPTLAAVEVTKEGVLAEAGADLTGLIHCVAAGGLSGMESLAGIPGSLGGALRGNAGAYGSCMADVTQNVWVLDTECMEFLLYSKDQCRFGYRSSNFKRNRNLIVVSAELSLVLENPEEVSRKVKETIEKRISRNLHLDKSVGSFFMNPLVTDPSLVRAFETERGVPCRDGRIPAGWFIERAGMRNQRVGDAMVSGLHANYLINVGNAKARDVLMLAESIKERVRETTGVQLMEEVCYLGFTPVIVGFDS